MTIFRHLHTRVELGKFAIGGGEITPEMVRASNWGRRITSRVSLSQGLVIKTQLGGTHGETVLLSPTTRELISKLGVKIPVFLLFVRGTDFQLRQKSSNLHFLQARLAEDLRAPIFDKRALKVLYYFENDGAAAQADQDAALLSLAVMLHFSRPCNYTRDDLFNVAENLRSKVVTQVTFGNLSVNPEDMARQIREELDEFRLKIEHQGRGLGHYLHLPPGAVRKDLGDEFAVLLMNPSDRSAKARFESFEKALGDLNVKANLRMGIPTRKDDVPRMIALVPLLANDLRRIPGFGGSPEDGVLNEDLQLLTREQLHHRGSGLGVSENFEADQLLPTEKIQGS